MSNDEVEMEPFEFEQAGTTSQAQAALAERGKRQKKPPEAMRVHSLPDVFVRPDAFARPPLAELRQWIVQRIQEDDPGTPTDRAVLYADLWIEYSEAQESIDRCGVICLHPRTSVIIENPYVARRDKTRQALAQVRDVRADWLWHPSNTDAVRTWLDAAVQHRDASLARAAMTAREKEALASIDSRQTG